VKRTLLAALLVVSCTSGPLGTVPQPQDVALKASEAKGLAKCPSSGSMDHTVAQLKGSDPTAYDRTNQEWSKLKQDGATGGYVAVYSDDPKACASFSPGAATSPSKQISNLVVQFTGSDKAAKAYGSGAFGVNPAQMSAVGGVSGSQTGLGKNSVRAFLSLGGTEVYLAYWQHDQWVTYLFAVGLSQADGDAMIKAIDHRM